MEMILKSFLWDTRNRIWVHPRSVVCKANILLMCYCSSTPSLWFFKNLCLGLYVCIQCLLQDLHSFVRTLGPYLCGIRDQTRVRCCSCQGPFPLYFLFDSFIGETKTILIFLYFFVKANMRFFIRTVLDLLEAMYLEIQLHWEFSPNIISSQNFCLVFEGPHLAAFRDYY